jgi:hypothetical protein
VHGAHYLTLPKGMLSVGIRLAIHHILQVVAVADDSVTGPSLFRNVELLGKQMQLVPVGP